MPITELRRLHKLHQVDQALLEIRRRAATLDPGRHLSEEIRTLEAQMEAAPARKLQAELNDLELQQKSMDEKLKKHDKEMYGGKVVNPREVEALGKEIAMLKRQRGEIDERILAIWEELPLAKEQLGMTEGYLAEKKQLLAKEHKAALEEKSRLQAEFKRLSEARPALTQEISPTLLARYEGIRHKHGGVGMGDMKIKTGTCGSCGTKLPTRTIESLKEDKVVTCEACHRILYYSEGAL